MLDFKIMCWNFFWFLCTTKRVIVNVVMIVCIICQITGQKVGFTFSFDLF